MSVITEELVHQTCCNCGVAFAMTKAVYLACKRDRGPRGRQFYCPNGHGQHYIGESDKDIADRLARELAQQKDYTESLRRNCVKADLSAKGFKVAAIRARNERDRIKARVQAGVCPCCNRTFQNLARHMATKHKDSK